MPIIQPLSRKSLAYIAAFDLRCICITSSGRVYTARSPTIGVVGAWWCKADDADRIAAVAWSTGDVQSAASQLRIALTPHETVLRRVGERVNKIDEAVRAAVDGGVLKEFNAQYRQRRLAARKAGKSFMSYSEALRRLRATVADAVAKDGTISKSFIAGVFDEALPRQR